jgi:hypothetical protein
VAVQEAFDLLETTTLTTSASSVTFSGLGAYSDYKHLQILDRGYLYHSYWTKRSLFRWLFDRCYQPS